MKYNFTRKICLAVLGLVAVLPCSVRAQNYNYQVIKNPDNNSAWTTATVRFANVGSAMFCIGPSYWYAHDDSGSWSQKWEVTQTMPATNETDPLKNWFHYNHLSDGTGFHSSIYISFDRWSAQDCGGQMKNAPVTWNSWFVMPTGMYGALMVPYGTDSHNWQERSQTTGLVVFPTQYKVTTTFTD